MLRIPLLVELINVRDSQLALETLNSAEIKDLIDHLCVPYEDTPLGPSHHGGLLLPPTNQTYSSHQSVVQLILLIVVCEPTKAKLKKCHKIIFTK